MTHLVFLPFDSSVVSLLDFATFHISLRFFLDKCFNFCCGRQLITLLYNALDNWKSADDSHDVIFRRTIIELGRLQTISSSRFCFNFATYCQLRGVRSLPSFRFVPFSFFLLFKFAFHYVLLVLLVPLCADVVRQLRSFPSLCQR